MYLLCQPLTGSPTVWITPPANPLGLNFSGEKALCFDFIKAAVISMPFQVFYINKRFFKALQCSLTCKKHSAFADA